MKECRMKSIKRRDDKLAVKVRSEHDHGLRMPKRRRPRKFIVLSPPSSVEDRCGDLGEVVRFASDDHVSGLD